MNERERILDLVKKGVLSTEEALDLLESMAKDKDEQQINQAAAEVTADKTTDIFDEVEPTTIETDDFDGEEKLRQNEAQDKENLEKILDSLATDANQASAELDEINVEIAGLKEELKEAQETVMQLNTKEELDQLSDEELASRQEAESTITDLEESLDALTEEKAALDAKLKNIRKDQWSQAKEKISQKLDIPEDWKEQATDTINQVSEKMVDAGSHFGRFLKKTMRTVTDSVNDNMEWKDINLKVPGVAATKFEHTFTYEETEATLIDIKLANGNVTFATWDGPGVKVDAKIKLYGKMEAVEPFEAFETRSQIEVDDERISFQIPNKRIRADLDFYLPKRTYDHVAVKLLNGNVIVNDLDAKDIYTKSTNGNIDFRQVNASMLEIEGVNGTITVREGDILDAIIETVNGDVTVTATPQNTGISLVNGNIRLTFKDTNLQKLNASSVNGNVKVALPEGIGFEGLAKTSLGSINNRLMDAEIVREKKERLNQLLQFRRVADKVAQIDLSTTTGNVFIKDTDK
ncbi:hypothetical protein A5886_001176 [Enterococcus sp. 8G7_MSG3316]|uniref:Uncharacterized protein n=1 Tax=Candidatus Enterococcus testudinis TaxID=1834191 RepID=A0A242A5A6_9ENTE|nr:daptomycin-sensing surface protein LiaX [Enterococcus sp. 8G7_MSG3316]OTN76099.1 hypothetical protein A5886_001176 [Enterococcus sp. 8G7_MSG3316]